MPLVVEDLLARVQEACRHLSVPPGDSYLSSYPLLLAHVAALTHSAPVDERALVAVAHLVYGWMPTVLHLDFMLLPGAVQQVEKARQGIILEAEELQHVLYPGSFGADEPGELEGYALFVRLPGWMPSTD